MSRLEWDQVSERIYDTGVDQMVLYLLKNGKYDKGVAWSGIISANENPSGAEENAYYADNIKYFSLTSAEELGLSIECYTYPDEWKQCDGSAEIAPGVYVGQQKRSSFGLCFRSKKGSAENEDLGYLLHLIYNCKASPSERTNQTISENPEPSTMSYDITTTPVKVNGFRHTSQILIDSTKVDAETLSALEAILYGSEDKEARLPLPDEIATLFGTAG